MSTEVTPGTEAAAIIGDEERLHAQVQARVALGGEDAGDRVDVDDYDRELISLRDAVGEAKPEDLAPLVEQMTRVAAIRSRLGRSRALPVDVGSPYFAHMVLREGERRRDVLIGKRGFIDRGSNVQIVDWRNAPISQIYYRYEEGDDYDEDIQGRRLEGLVEVRRNVSIAGSRLRRIGAPQGTFIRDAHNHWHVATGAALPVLQGGSGKAARAARPAPPQPGKVRRDTRLGVHHGPIHRADKHLPEIAALIDKEQFDLISRPESGLVVIQGGAGSGKTTVALHRVAYLNFADGTRFRANRMLVVVPSPALARYVADVLPALGVPGVPVVTYADWARTQRRRLVPGVGRPYADDTPDAVARLKKHPALIPLLEECAAAQVIETDRRLTAELGAGSPVVDRWRRSADKALVPRLRALYAGVKRDTELAAPARLQAEGLLRSLGMRAADILTDWAEILTDHRLLAAAFARHGGDVAERDIAALVAWCTAQQAGAHRETYVDHDGNPIAPIDGGSIDDDGPAGRFDAEDDPILLRLVQLKRGGLIDKEGHDHRYEHVAIDEAQDRSALEVKVLLEAVDTHGQGPAARSVTIAGDTAQRLVFDNSFGTWEQLLERTGHGAAVMRPLKLSYRSTAEVMQLARDILGPLAPDDPLVARSGAPVELHEFSEVGEAVGFLAEALRGLAGREPTASVAVIARYPEQADGYLAGLQRAEVPSVRRVRRHDFSFAPGIDVTDITQVKGLEFDYVVLVDVNAASYPDTVESRHLLHIGATRAAHQLWLIATGEVSALIPGHLNGGGLL